MLKWVILLLLNGLSLRAIAQLPVEWFIGHSRTTFDVMFFRSLSSKQQSTTPWLFFNRNRVAIDYRMTSKQYLPQFGSTAAISYQLKNGKGFAPVFVMQLSNTAVSPKLGIQWARSISSITLFSWCVASLEKETSIDYFLLARWTPPLGSKINLFTQLESVNQLPTHSAGAYKLTQRLRLGVALSRWQTGAGLDLNQSGRGQWQQQWNLGPFIRHEL